MAEKKRSKKKVDAADTTWDPLQVGTLVDIGDGIEFIPPIPESIAPDPVTIRTVGNTHNYTLLEHVDAVRGAFKYQVINEKNGTTHDFESLSQAVQYLHEAGLR